MIWHTQKLDGRKQTPPVLEVHITPCLTGAFLKMDKMNKIVIAIEWWHWAYVLTLFIKKK